MIKIMNKKGKTVMVLKDTASEPEITDDLDKEEEETKIETEEEEGEDNGSV